MKSERRHELQHNDLAEWILKAYERTVPYKNAIFGASLLLLVFLIALVVWHNHSLSEAGEAWSKLGVPIFEPVFWNDPTISVMDQTAKSYQGEPAAQWAEVFAADTALMAGTNKILTNKKIGIEFLSDAQKRYTEALKTLTIPGAREQALFGKARAVESLIQNADDLKAAKEAYEELTKSFPDGMFKAAAERRIEQLQKKDTLKFYEALAQYNPKPKVESPHSTLDSHTPLPDNPTEEMVPKTPVRGEGAQSGPSPAIPAPSLTPTEPVKDAPKTDLPKTEPAKSQPPKPDAPKPDAPKTDSPKTDAPKTVAPKTDAPKADTPKADTPKPDGPKTDAPKADTPKPDAAKKDK